MIRNGSDGASGGGSWITGVDGFKRLGQVDDPDAAVGDKGGEFQKEIRHVVILFIGKIAYRRGICSGL